MKTNTTTVNNKLQSKMKKLIIALLFPALAFAQSTNQNFIKTTTYKGAGATNPSSVVTYFDGLGRPMQKIDNAQSNTGKDIVTHIEYDAYGRQPKEFLPYPSSQTSMAYVAGVNASSGTISYYQTQYGDTNPFSEKLLEASPLDRVLEQAAPGNPWGLTATTKHTIRLDYQTNTATEVKLFKVTTTWNSATGVYNISINSSGNYDANELYKSVTKDENWTSGLNNTTEEFKDKDGRVVLKRTYNNAVAHDTYYVYDTYGNLTYVIPPLANGAFDQNTLDGLCYQYKYDHRNRLVEKKLPGKQWEYLIYDKLDRVVATGPALSPFANLSGNGWLITKYDAFSRPILTGWYANNVSADQRGVLQSSINGGSVFSETKTTSPTTINGVGFNYSTVAWPTSGYHVLTVNYYDDYLYPHAETIPTTVLGLKIHYNNTQKPKSLATGSWIRIADTSTLYNAEKSMIYYDYKARPIRTKTINHLGGYTQVDSQLDFSGKVIATETRHKRLTGDVELLTREDFTYSAQDRLLTHTHQIDGGAKQLLVKNTYDEMGQLIGKNVGGNDVTGTTSLQKVDYKYNIRGWLKEINDINNLTQGTNPQDLFAFKINYNDNLTTGLPANQTAVTQLFNGNISETFWRTASDNKTRKYGYQYDQLNRLTNAIYQDPAASIVTNSFNESLSYDMNGNIMSLNRKNYMASAPFNTTIDNLTYTYDTVNKNELRKVGDSTINAAGFKDGSNTDDDFAYDANGNMTLDKNKGITAISYNHLNLPIKIDFGTNKIEYIYNAVGQKVQKKVTISGVATTSEYLGGYQYKAAALEFFPHTEGYVKNDSGVYSYVFNYTDHLGNIRVSYRDVNKNGILGDEEIMECHINRFGTQVCVFEFVSPIIEENNYYSFGLKHEGYNTNNYQPNYKYKFQGKELQDELGLNWYDFGGRLYMQDIVRTTTIDPLAEKFYNLSPQSFLNNNPLAFIDPTGKGTEDWFKDKNGVMQFDPKVKNQDDASKKGGTYVGETDRQTTKSGGTADFRKDGSIVYSKEQDAYSRVMSNTKLTGREQLAVMGQKSSIVLPDYKNTIDRGSSGAGMGYTFKNGNLQDPITGKSFNTLGTIHAHMTGGGPSTYLVTGYGDLDFARINTPNKPVYVMQNEKGVDGLSVIWASPFKAGQEPNYGVMDITSKIPALNSESIQNGTQSLINFTLSADWKGTLNH